MIQIENLTLNQSLVNNSNYSCRSTLAKHAANPYQPERHPDAQVELKHHILSTRL